MNLSAAIEAEDYGAVRAVLLRIVRSSRFVSRQEAEDIASDLFLELWRKHRFRVYLTQGMDAAAIERQIRLLELPNLLSVRRRRETPEKYRLARRIAELLDADPAFARFSGAAPGARFYGLAGWPIDAPRRPLAAVEHRLRGVAFPAREYRQAGCAGTSALVVSTERLRRLLAETLAAAEAVLSLSDLRGFALARLSLQDAGFLPFARDEEGRELEPAVFADERPDAERRLLERESRAAAAALAGSFLDALRDDVRHKPKRVERIERLCFEIFLRPDALTQLEIAARLGVSDSLVSSDRRLVERRLAVLPLRSIEEAEGFRAALLWSLSAWRKNPL